MPTDMTALGILPAWSRMRMGTIKSLDLFSLLFLTHSVSARYYIGAFSGLLRNSVRAISHYFGLQLSCIQALACVIFVCDEAMWSYFLFVDRDCNF